MKTWSNSVECKWALEKVAFHFYHVAGMATSPPPKLSWTRTLTFVKVSQCTLACSCTTATLCTCMPGQQQFREWYLHVDGGACLVQTTWPACSPTLVCSNCNLHFPSHTHTHTLPGYGFVDFENPADAQKAVIALQSVRIQAQFAKLPQVLLLSS